MLKQIKLCPSGCQYWNKSIICRGENLIAYCSTLAIYFIDIATFSIVKIIAAHQQTISCITWNYQDPKEMASVSIDNSLYIWNVDSDSPVAYLQLANTVLMMEYDPFNRNNILFLFDSGDVQIFDITTRALIKKGNYVSFRPKILKFHTTVEGKFAMGCAEGVVLAGNMTNTTIEKLAMNKQKTQAEDVQWDPLSDKYLLVSFKDGSLVLFDVQARIILQNFDRQGAGIKSIAWNRAVPGEFFTSSEKVSGLRVWNVSKKAPIDSLKAGISGIRNLSYHHDKNSLICAFKNGSVGLFSLVKKKLEFVTEPGHAETVFDIEIHPRDKNLLGTTSYDGTVKLWNVRTMSHIDTLHSDALESGQFKGVMQTKAVCYGIAWGPDNMIAVSTAKGDVLLYDYAKRKLIQRLRPATEAPIYRISWSQLNPTLVAVGTSDHCLVVLKLEGNKLTKHRVFKHPKVVYGTVWHPFTHNIIATGCTDALVRVYDIEGASDRPLYELRGHEGKVFNLAWNPILPHLLATSSDDHTVVVWDTEQRSLFRRLVGHTQNTRAIIWNTEICWMLLSGSWDSHIRVWDIRSGECLYAAKEHHADIYGITSHPERPFLYISCSRDTSIRFWSMEEFIESAFLKVLGGGAWSELRGPPSLEADKDFSFAGYGSQLVEERLVVSNPVERLREIISFFQYRSGEEDFFDMLNYLLNSKKGNANNRVLPIEDLCSAKRERANELETASGMAFLGSSLAKKEDRLQEAANTHLKLGNIQEYCELMIKLGNWEQAMAFAPGYCLDYWQHVAQRYATMLAASEKEDTSKVLIVSGKTDKAIQFFMKRKDHEDALLLASSKSTGVFTEVPAEPPRSSVSQNVDLSILQEITSKLADEYFELYEPILAAASHLSLRDFNAALIKCLRAHELAYAYAIATLYGVKSYQLSLMLAKKAEKHKDWDACMKFASDHIELQELLLAKAPAGVDVEMSRKYSLLSSEEYINRANSEFSRGNKSTAMRYYLAGKNSEAAVNALIEAALSSLNSKENMQEIFEMIPMLAFASIEEIEIRSKATVLALSALFGGIQSWWRGYPVTRSLFGTYLSLCSHQSLDFPIAPSIALIIPAIIETHTSIDAATMTINGILDNLSSDERHIISGVLSQANKHTVGKAEPTKNAMKIVGANLPINNLQAQQPVSIFSRKVIRGSIVWLQSKMAISQEEAIMWAKVNPFSPMNDGSILNPY